ARTRTNPPARRLVGHTSSACGRDHGSSRQPVTTSIVASAPWRSRRAGGSSETGSACPTWFSARTSMPMEGRRSPPGRIATGWCWTGPGRLTALRRSLQVQPARRPALRTGTKLADSAVTKKPADSPPTEAPGLDATVAELTELARTLPDRINADPERVEQGLARLVLTVIELLRRVLEHQAIRRMDGGSLSDQEIEQLGLALMKLSQRMDELKETFGLSDDDLSIDLGPLGELR